MVQRAAAPPFQGDFVFWSERKKKRNYGHNKAMHALERGCGNVACLGERKEINEN